jgi:glutamine phosphoribosylpyrophosphate amidotransferase
VHGIRPLILGQRETEHGTDYIFASESVVLDVLGYTVMGDVAPGALSGGGFRSITRLKAGNESRNCSKLECQRTDGSEGKAR